MQCHELENHLEQREADALSADAQAHMNDCARCRAMVEDLRAIEVAARELSAEAEPPARVWSNLRAQMLEEGLIRAAEAKRSGWRAWSGAWARPALAVAYVASLAIAAVLIGLQGDAGKTRTNIATNAVNGTQAAQAALDRQLGEVERGAVASMHKRDPAVAASLRQNLDIVDNSIALCEKSLHQNPQNQLARDSLYSAYQQKAQLLAMMVDRDAVGD